MKLLTMGLAATVLSGIVSGRIAAAPGNGVTPATYDSLSRVSDALFAAHSQDYLVVDALRDGYLLPGQYYEMQIYNNPASVTINGQKLAAEAGARYAGRYREFDFYDGHIPQKDLAVMYKGRGYYLEQILDPQSEFRKARVRKPSDLAQANIGRILQEMILDKLIADKSNFAISYTSSGLLVNQAPLPGVLDAKYRMLFRVFMDVEPKDGRGDYVYSLSSGAGK